MAWDGPVLDLGGALGDEDHAGDDPAAARELTLRSAQGSTGPQGLVQFLAQRSTSLDIERQVNGLVGHPHLRVVGVLDSQPPGYLLR
jgi:hypothetical protein